MPATSPDGLRWPVDLDAADAPTWLKTLAEDTQAALNHRVPAAEQNLVTSALAELSLTGAEAPVRGPAAILSSSGTAAAGWANTAGAPLTYTIPKDGWWTTEYAVQGGEGTAALAEARIMQRVQNGSQTRVQGFRLLPSVVCGASMATTFHVLAGNTIEYFVYHQSPQTLGFACYMSWAFVSS